MAKKSVVVEKQNEITLQALAVKNEMTQEQYVSKLVNDHLEKNQTHALESFKMILNKREKAIYEEQKKKKQSEQMQKNNQVKNNYHQDENDHNETHQ